MSRTTYEGDLLFGGAAIAKYLGLTKRQVYHLAEIGDLPSFKLGESTCALRSQLSAWIEGRIAQAREKACA